jgi:hypothetical protein
MFVKLNSLGLGNVTMEFLQGGVKRTVLGFDNSTNDFVITTDKANAVRPGFYHQCSRWLCWLKH